MLIDFRQTHKKNNMHRKPHLTEDNNLPISNSWK